MDYDNLTPDEAAILTSKCEVDYEDGVYFAFYWHTGTSDMLIEEGKTVLSAVIAVHKKKDQLDVDI